MSARHFRVLHTDTVMAASMNRHKSFTSMNVLNFLLHNVGLTVILFRYLDKKPQ